MNQNSITITAQQPVITLNAESQQKFINNLSSKFESAQLNVIYTPTFMLSDLETMGIKYASLSFGRDIDVKHVGDLFKDLQKSGKMVFTKKAIAISALSVLEANINNDGNVKVYDESGEELSLQTPGIENYIVFLDGNHRWMVHRIHPEVDLIVEVACIDDPFLFMANYNKLSNNWGITNWIKANIATGKINGAIHTNLDKVQDLLGVSLKWANYLLTRERECVKKSDLELGKDTTTNNPDFIKRGMMIAGAIAYAYPKPGKNSSVLDKVLYKGVRTLQFIDGIEAADKSYPSPEFYKQFASLILMMTTPEKEILYRRFEEKDYVGLKKFLVERYSDFIKTHEKDLADVIQDSEAKISKAWTSTPSESEKPQLIKAGTAKEILDSMKNVEAHKNEMSAKKDLDKAIDVFQKAEEALDTANTNLNIAAPKHKERAVEKLKEVQMKYESAKENLDKAQEAYERCIKNSDSEKAA